jgi:hypothetical protein
VQGARCPAKKKDLKAVLSEMDFAHSKRALTTLKLRDDGHEMSTRLHPGPSLYKSKSNPNAHCPIQNSCSGRSSKLLDALDAAERM